MLTIAETVVRNRERRRRALVARREGKAIAQVVAEENHDCLARMVAESLAPIMAGNRIDAPAHSVDASIPSEVDPHWRLLECEVTRISGQIESVGRELASVKELLSRVPSALPLAAHAPTSAAQAAPEAEEAPPRQSAPPRESPSKVPIGDIAAMIDHIQQQYYR